MIIKIENLPEGQTIKHINIDISFDDDGNPQIQTTRDSEVSFEESSEIPEVESPVTDEEREHIDVPPEMTDVEF